MPDQYQTAPDQNFESLVPAMNPKKSHRWIVWIVGLIFLIVLATAAYFLFFSGSPSPEPTSQSQVENVPKVLLSEKVISPILSFNGENIWFATDEGKMFRLKTDGNTQKEEYPLPISTHGITEVIWEKDGSDFIFEYTSDGHTRYKYYDSTNAIFAEYPGQMRQINFLPAGNSIVYDWVTSTTTHELKVALPTGEGFRTVSSLFLPDYQIAVSLKKAEVVLYRDDRSDLSNLIHVDLETGKFTDLDEKATYQGVKFSPDGTKVLAVKKGRLAVYDLSALQKKDLEVAADIEQVSWKADSSAVIVGDAEGFAQYDVVTGQAAVLY